jgi:hypothetical protein
MKKLLIVIITLGFLSDGINAQLWKSRRYEISGGIGTTQFFGDIGGYSNTKNVLGIRDFTFLQTRFNINANLRYRITEDISLRVNLVYGLFHATDSRGSNVRRGFECSTTFFEPSLIAEYYFIKNKEENSFVFLNKNETLLRSFFASLDFYAFAGFGGLAYKVKPNDILSPSVTSTGGITAVVPLGLGVTMIYSGKINFGFEVGGRFTYSDNLDGFTSLSSQYNDVYHLVNFTVTYKIAAGKTGVTRFRK